MKVFVNSEKWSLGESCWMQRMRKTRSHSRFGQYEQPCPAFPLVRAERRASAHASFGSWYVGYLARPSRLTNSHERANEQTPPNRSSYPNMARYRCSTHPHLPIATPHRTTCPFPLSKLHSTCSHSHCTLCSRYRRTHLISLSHYRLPRSCHPRRSLRRYHGGKSNKYGGCVRRRTRKKRVKHCKAS